jgi:hypothetical protein
MELTSRKKIAPLRDSKFLHSVTNVTRENKFRGMKEGEAGGGDV